jgi:hypothetical protein
VRLTYVDTNADVIDSPVADSIITIQAGAARFDKSTNKNGVAVFEAIPCGSAIQITVQDVADDDKTVLRSRLVCQGREVNLGVITTAFGGKPVLAKRRTKFYGYDPVKGVWRDKDGRVIPNKVIRRILGT